MGQIQWSRETTIFLQEDYQAEKNKLTFKPALYKYCGGQIRMSRETTLFLLQDYQAGKKINIPIQNMHIFKSLNKNTIISKKS